MPPYFFDHVDIQQAVRQDVVPTLEALATNDGLRDRSLRRFDTDDPPSYESSTEPDQYDMASHHVADGQVDEQLPDHVLAILERPLDDTELERIAAGAHHILSPAQVFYGDALREENRMPFSNSFREVTGMRRQGLLVRHVLKNRWKKLGVWNEAWGFAGRNVAPEDRYEDWRWPWEPQGNEDREAVDAARKQLVMRALRLRQNLARGEHTPGIPLAHLEPGSTVAQAESFLISRPWFLYRLEKFDETMRRQRLDQDTFARYEAQLGPSVKERWQERGDWRPEFNFGVIFGVERVASWKWRHESPSPEPEDLSCTEKPWRNAKLREYHDDLHFTPSELDEMDILERPMTERPENSWIVQKTDFNQPPIPGQVHRHIEERSLGLTSVSGRMHTTVADVKATEDEVVDDEVTEDEVVDDEVAEDAVTHDTAVKPTLDDSRLSGNFGTRLDEKLPSQEELTDDDPEETENEEEQEAPEEPPLSAPTDLVPEQSKQSENDALPPAPRQSARAAASRKREAEAPLPDPSPPKRPRRTKAPPAAPAAAATGKAAPSTTTTGAKRGRPGRPRKTEDQEALPATRKQAPAKKAPETVARRGRPPKDQTQEIPSAAAVKGGKKATPKPAAVRRGRPPKSESQAKPSVAVTKAKQRITAKVVGKRGRPAKSQAAQAETSAAMVKRSKPVAAAAAEPPPKVPARRGRPARVPTQSQDGDKTSAAAVAAKAPKKSGKPAAPEEAVAPRRGRPAKAIPTAAAAATTAAAAAAAAAAEKSKQTAPGEGGVIAPRRGRPSKAAAAAAEVLAVAENGTPDEVVTPRRGRPSKVQDQEKNKVATAATAATAASAKNKKVTETVAPEESVVITPRRGRPSKAATTAATAAAAAAAAAEKSQQTPPDEENAAAAAASATPRRRGRPAAARQTATATATADQTQDDGSAIPATLVNGVTKKKAGPAGQKTAASNRVTKRTAALSNNRKAKIASTASPPPRARGRPRRA